MTGAVVVDRISKSYGRHRALNGVSFEAEPGSIFGLIGPNGAGKTTTLSILAGLVAPSSGSASILGMEVEPNRRELVSRVGFASPQLAFFDYLSGEEVVLTCGMMHGLKPREAERRLRDLTALLDLEAAIGHYVYQYSYGMRQKLGLACAFVHSPDVLLLDEPFHALDPSSLHQVFHTLRRMSDNGRTIVITSHDLTLVGRLCDRVGILHEGVLKREIRLTPGNGGAVPFPGGAGLESVLWEVVGAPEYRELTWI